MSQALPCDGTDRRLLAAIADADPRLTDADIARFCGVDRSLVGHWRSADRSMPAWALARILRRLSPAQASVVLAELAPEGVSVAESAPAPGSSLMVDAAMVAGAGTTLARIVAVAQADGRVTADEAKEIHAALSRVEALTGTARSTLRVAR